MLQEFRYAIRRMWQGRAWAALVVLSCALGIGASAAMFSVVEAVLLRDLDVERADELVYLQWYSGPNGLYQFLSGNSDSDETGRQQSTSFSTLTFEQIRQRSRTLAHVFAFAPLREANIRVDDLAEIADGQFVSGNYFDALRLPGLRGRPLTESDNQLGATPAVVISDRYWQQRFKRNPNAIGQILHVNGIAFTIVGITPPAFAGAHGYSYAPGFSIPMAFEAQMFPDDGHSQPWSWWLRIMGRLSPGLTRAQAQSELEPLIQHAALQGWNVAPARAESRNQTRDLPHLQVLDGSRGLTDQVRNIAPMMKSLAAIVGLLMLIVCVNIANLMLAQAANRQREFGVRLALGASRERLVRLLLTETLTLCGAAVLLGILLAAWGIDVLALVVSKVNGTSVDLRLDLRVVAFAVVSALFAASAFGLIPALRATRIDVVTHVKEGASNVLGRRSPLTSLLVVAQLALSLALLVAAGLLVQSVRGLRRIDVGFDANNLLLFELNAEAVGYDEQRTVGLYEKVIRRLETLPGVVAATTSEYPLVSGSWSGNSFYLQGRNTHADDAIIRRMIIRANFLQIMGVGIVQGRDLSERDDQRAPRVAVINQTLARRFFGSGNPVGQRFGLGSAERGNEIEIVGVARDAWVDEVRGVVPPAVYLPYLQRVHGNATFEVRTTGDPDRMIPAIQRLLREVAADVPVVRFRTQQQQIALGFATEHLLARTSIFFGAVALLLACLGLYGMLSYNVARRTSEIAVRMALGARRDAVIWLVLREVALLLLIGGALGVAGAFALTRTISTLLYGLGPNDPLTLIGAVIALVTVGAFAGYLPARRAARIEPWTALRYD